MGIRLLPSGRFRLQIRRTGLTVDEVYDTKAGAEAALSKYLGSGPADKRARKAGGVSVDEAVGGARKLTFSPPPVGRQLHPGSCPSSST